jgi:hypothetical protein
MATEPAKQSHLELFDVAKKERVATAPLGEIGFIPRAGERIFIPLKGTGDWESYTVVGVEYFLGYDATGEPARSISKGFGRITLFVEGAK